MIYIYMSMLCMRSSFLFTILLQKKISKKMCFFLCMEISQLDIDLYSVYMCSVRCFFYLSDIYVYVCILDIDIIPKIINIIFIKKYMHFVGIFKNILCLYIPPLPPLCVCVIF